MEAALISLSSPPPTHTASGFMMNDAGGGHHQDVQMVNLAFGLDKSTASQGRRSSLQEMARLVRTRKSSRCYAALLVVRDPQSKV